MVRDGVGTFPVTSLRRPQARHQDGRQLSRRHALPSLCRHFSALLAPRGAHTGTVRARFHALIEEIFAKSAVVGSERNAK